MALGSLHEDATERKEKAESENCPSGSVVKNPPSNAGDSDSIPGLGTKIPYAMGQLCPRAATTEVRALKSQWSATREACTRPLEKAHVLQQRPGSTKIIIKKEKEWEVLFSVSLAGTWLHTGAPTAPASACGSLWIEWQ